MIFDERTKRILSDGGFYDRNHNWNSAIKFISDDNIYRHRVETIIVRDNREVFLKKKPNGEYFLPGGSVEKDIPNIVQAINECIEEARINVRNIEPTGISYKMKYKNDIYEDYMPIKYYGSYTEIYVAEYNSIYKGNIRKVDRDPFILSGRFYPVKQCLKFFKKEHRDALVWFLKNNVQHNEVVSESIYQNNLNNYIYKNIKSPEQLLEWIKKEIKVGENDFDNFSPNNIYISKIGNCHELALFISYILNRLHIKNGLLFIADYDNKTNQYNKLYTTVWYKKDKKYYWFDIIINSEKGILGPYESLLDIKKEIKNKLKNDYQFLYFYNVKNIKYDINIYDYINNCISKLNENIITNNNQNQPLYFLSTTNLNNQILKPKIPNNYFSQNNYEDNQSLRIIFAPTIEKAIMIKSQLSENKLFYVHIPDINQELDIYKPSINEVPDSDITDEYWVKNNCKLKCIGIIELINIKNRYGNKFVYGKNKIAELYEWNWKWKEKF